MSTNRQRKTARQDAQVIVVPNLVGTPPAAFRNKINQIVLKGFKKGETPEEVAAKFLEELRYEAAKVAHRQRGGIGPIRLPTQAITNSFKLDCLNGLHQPGDTYKIALYVSATSIGAGTTAYTATNEVANGGGYTTAGLTLGTRAASLDGSTAILDFADAVWTSATITARGALIYNSTRSNASLCVLDFGSDIVSTNGNFSVIFPAAAAATALIRIA